MRITENMTSAMVQSMLNQQQENINNLEQQASSGLRINEPSDDPASAQQQAYGLLYGVLQQQAALFAYVDTFRRLALLCLVCVPLVLLFRKMRARGGAAAMH